MYFQDPYEYLIFHFCAQDLFLIFFREKMAFFTAVNTNVPLIPSEVPAESQPQEGTSITSKLEPSTVQTPGSTSTLEEGEFSDNNVSYDEEIISSSSTLDGDSQSQITSLDNKLEGKDITTSTAGTHATSQTENDYSRFDRLVPISEV